MNNTLCPACHETPSQEGKVLFEVLKTSNESYQIKKCGNCGMIYTFFNHEVNINDLYDQNDYLVRDTRNSIFFKIQRWEYNVVINKIKEICSLSRPSILDFGSGKGLFLHFADLKRCYVKGVESSKPRANYAKEYFGLDINTDFYSSGQIFDQKFDVITLFHVLEHLQNPSELIEGLIHSNLNKGGLLIIEVPNFGSWQSKWAGNTWLHLDVPRHINHFTNESLQKIIQKTGGLTIKKEYFSLHLGIIGMVQSILSWFGYKGFLIAELKEKKNRLLMAKILITLPFAILLESLAAVFKRGGIIRYYMLYDSTNDKNSFI